MFPGYGNGFLQSNGVHPTPLLASPRSQQWPTPSPSPFPALQMSSYQAPYYPFMQRAFPQQRLTSRLGATQHQESGIKSPVTVRSFQAIVPKAEDEVSHTDENQGAMKQPNLRRGLLQARLNKSPFKKLPTFVDIFEKYVQEWEEQNQNLLQAGPQARPGQSYTLYEDLKIIVSSREKEINSTLKQDLAGILPYRSYDSKKTRYMHFLKNLSDDNISSIIDHLQDQGVTGYLHFTKQPNSQQRIFLRTSKHDPKKQKIDRNNAQSDSSISKDQEEDNQSAQEQEQQYQQYEIQRIAQSRPQAPPYMPYQGYYYPAYAQMPTFRGVEEQIRTNYRKRKAENSDKSRVENDENLSEEEIQHRKKIKHRSVTEIMSEQQINEMHELEDVINVIHENVDKNFTKKELIQIVDQLSGDLNIFDKYLQDPKQQEKLLWQAYEDELLSQAKRINDPGLLVLEQNKGKENVKKRIQYLELYLDFEY